MKEKAKCGVKPHCGHLLPDPLTRITQKEICGEQVGKEHGHETLYLYSYFLLRQSHTQHITATTVSRERWQSTNQYSRMGLADYICTGLLMNESVSH